MDEAVMCSLNYNFASPRIGLQQTKFKCIESGDRSAIELPQNICK